MLYIYLFLLAINPIADLMPSQAVSQLPVSLSGILYFRQIRIKQQLKSLSLSPSHPLLALARTWGTKIKRQI